RLGAARSEDPRLPSLRGRARRVECSLQDRPVLIEIRRIALHPRRDLPIGQLDGAFVAETRLLRDELAHEERALPQHLEEGRAARQPIRITETTEANRALVDRECPRL